jgi:HTH-type transcriptional repressor of NAD biosynthesis genes
MRARFRRGLVVGKLAPLHRGHELLIRTALEQCDELILLTYSKPELPGCGPQVRAGWLAALFPTVRALSLTDELLRPHNLTVPANDAADDEHRRLVGRVLAQVLGVAVDAVFTSEDYGDGLAAALGSSVTHVMVDRERRQAPVSGTLVRSDPFAHRQWLSPVVLASFVRRVCLLGGESSGKTTLARTLAQACQTAWVAEYGRELWEARRGALAYPDMLSIAQRQLAAEERMTLESGRWLFCDTSPLTTAFYSHELFGQVDPRLDALARETRYHATFLCAPDFPFVQDGTRRDPAFRSRQHLWYRRALDAAGIPYQVVSGPIPARVARVRTALGGSDQ